MIRKLLETIDPFVGPLFSWILPFGLIIFGVFRVATQQEHGWASLILGFFLLVTGGKEEEKDDD